MEQVPHSVLVIQGGSWAQRIGNSPQGEANLQKIFEQIHAVTRPYYQAAHSEAETHVNNKTDQPVYLWGSKRVVHWESFNRFGRYDYQLEFFNTKESGIRLDNLKMKLPHRSQSLVEEELQLSFDQSDVSKLSLCWKHVPPEDPYVKVDKESGLGKYLQDFCESQSGLARSVVYKIALYFKSYPSLWTCLEVHHPGRSSMEFHFRYSPNEDLFVRSLTDKDQIMAEKFNIGTGLTLNPPTFIDILRSSLALIPTELRPLGKT